TWAPEVTRPALRGARVIASSRITHHVPLLLHLLGAHGPALLGAHDRGLEHLLGLERVFEVRHRHDRLLPADDFHDVGGLVNEAVLVANDVRVGPPVADIGVVAAVRDHDAGP